MLQPGELFHNRYLLKEMKGRGAFGEVWLARDQELDTDVAIKVYIALDTRGVEEFKSEFKTTMGLYHPNLLKADHFDIVNDRPYLVMPFCPDSSTSLIGNIDEPTVWRFIHDVASGLEYLHRMDVIHHDIKPDNILINENGDFVITDFGISVRIRSTLRRNSSRQVQTDMKGGSLAYMAPEMFTQEAESVNATDIWAFGATLYELMTGSLPFFGQSGVMQLKGAAVPEVPGPYSDQLKNVVKQCLAKDTWDRPMAKQLVQYAQDALSGGNSSKAEEKPAEVKHAETVINVPQKKNNTLIYIIIAAVLLGGIGIALWALQPSGDSPMVQNVKSGPSQEDLERIELFKDSYDKKVKHCNRAIEYISDNNNDFIQALIALQELEDLENHPDFKASKLTPMFQSTFDSFISKLTKTRDLVKSQHDQFVKDGMADETKTFYTGIRDRLILMNAILNQAEGQPKGHNSATTIKLPSPSEQQQAQTLNKPVQEQPKETTKNKKQAQQKQNSQKPAQNGESTSEKQSEVFGNNLRTFELIVERKPVAIYYFDANSSSIKMDKKNKLANKELSDLLATEPISIFEVVAYDESDIVSSDRANAVVRQLKNLVKNANLNENSFNYSTKAYGFDWDTLKELIQNSSINDKNQIITKLNNSSDRNSALQDLMMIYPEIRDFMPMLRRAEVFIY